MKLSVKKVNGIAIVGNIIADIVKRVDSYPEKGMLTYVINSMMSVGGCMPNTAISLAVIDSKIPIYVGGKVKEFGLQLLVCVNTDRAFNTKYC